MLPVVLVPMQHNAGEQEKQSTATVTGSSSHPPSDPSEDVKLSFTCKPDSVGLHLEALVSECCSLVAIL